MKLSCKVIEDMLPIYYDGICSDESTVLIEEHLKGCPGCSQVLSNLRSEIAISEKTIDDLKPLAQIQKKWKNRKNVYIKCGIAIALAAMLLIAAVLSGIWYFSYAKYYYQMTACMERTPAEDTFTSSDYTVEKDGYRFEVWLPIILSDSGFVRVMADDGIVLFLYPEVGGDYSFWLYITDEHNEAWSVYLKADMTPDFENHPFPVRSEKQKEHITQLLSKQHDNVAAILNAVRTLWGIELLNAIHK